MRSALYLALVACGSDPAATVDAQLPATDSVVATTDGTTDAPTTDCPRTAPTGDTHEVVVSRPYDAAGNGANTFEVLSLAADGTLTRPNVTFQMGRTSFGSIQFTPDGKIGMVPQSDGTLGVFSLAADGTPTVVSAGFGKGMFYASRVVFDPTGAYAYVLDSDTVANKGGIYALSVACDGTPTLVGKIAMAGTPNGLILDGDKAYLAVGQGGLDAPVSNEALVLHWPGGTQMPTVSASSDAFGNDDAIIGGFAITHDRSAMLLGDTSFGHTNRVGIVKVTATALTPATVITPLVDPEAIVASPFGNVALVTSTADGDAIYIFDDNAGAGWRNRGKVTYKGAAPQIPGDMAPIARGALNGRTLVSELSAIRQLQFNADGSVTDIGSLTFGGDDDLDQILGAIGVTP